MQPQLLLQQHQGLPSKQHPPQGRIKSVPVSRFCLRNPLPCSVTATLSMQATMPMFSNT